MCKTIGRCCFNGKKRIGSPWSVYKDRSCRNKRSDPNQTVSENGSKKKKKNERQPIEKIRPNTHTHTLTKINVYPLRFPHRISNEKIPPKKKEEERKKKVFLYLHSSNLSLGSNKAPSLLLFSIDSFHSLEFSQLETRQTWHRALETARLSHVCDGHHPRALLADTSLPKETTVFSTTFLSSPTFDCFQIGPTALHYLDTHTLKSTKEKNISSCCCCLLFD